MKDTVVRDSLNRPIGFIRTQGTISRIVDTKGATRGTFNRSTDTTVDRSGRVVGRGDQLIRVRL